MRFPIIADAPGAGLSNAEVAGSFGLLCVGCFLAFGAIYLGLWLIERFIPKGGTRDTEE